MKLEERVCSFELSKKLKKLGVPQDSYWSWWRDCCKAHENITETIYLGSEGENPNDIKIASAFTVAELGEKLKEWCKSANFCPLPLFDKQTKKWNNQYADDFTADTEADARAQLLVYFINDGTIEVKKLKRGK